MLDGNEGQTGGESQTTGTEGAASGGEGASGGQSANAPSAGGAEGGLSAILRKGAENAKAAAAKAAPATGQNAAPATPSYQPNFKFKVLDKELEFDEFVRGAVKDAETEKKVRDLYERAYGLDSVKADRQTLKGELAQAKEKIAETDQVLETLGSYVQKEDFDSFFDSLRIPKDKILRYALELVQREQWSPEEKARWQASREAQVQARYYQDQNARLLASQQQLGVQQREFELSTTLSRPEVTSVAQAYDAGMGNPGAFREYVIRIGQAYAAQGKDIPVEQAVSEAIRHLRAVNPQLGAASQQAAAQPQTPPVVAPNTKPTLPSVSGRGTSAVRSTIKSLADINKRRAELEAQGA